MEGLTEIDRLTGSVYLLRDLIRERLGLSLEAHDGTGTMLGRLAGRVGPAGCKSVLDYYDLLLSNEGAAKEEWRQLAAVLASPKSGFWRHSAAVRTLVEVALPRLTSASPPEPIRIWSACCSTGEEPLSIAMALNEAGWFERAAVQVHASDASFELIDRARRGLYADMRVNQLDVSLREKYFKREQDGWRVLPELHERIDWKLANLMDEMEVAELARSHVVFCQNVFIYFTGHAICKTLRLLGRFMPAGAYLFSDSGEFFRALVSSSNQFEPLSNESSVWIRRGDAR
jgi:chemotaxis protein methyltransferase CheR